jgi:hypothetical protein
VEWNLLSFSTIGGSETILGLRCYRSILEIVEPVDIAVIITPSNVVPQVLEECGRKGGVKAAVIIFAGFKEIGEQGKILEDKIKRIAKDYGIRLIGPNCIGFIDTDPRVSLNASFTKGQPVMARLTYQSIRGEMTINIIIAFVDQFGTATHFKSRIISISLPARNTKETLLK